MHTHAAEDLVRRTQRFIHDVVLPMETKFRGNIEAAGGDKARIDLQERARDAGVFGPQVPTEFGGHGLNMTERAPVFEEAGYSLFGPLALNIQAPDEGNIHLLDHTADADQRSRFLAPLAQGEVRSAFAMTEPSPGAGSDPQALETFAVKVPGGWRINGTKHFITGADGAGFFIVMARTDEGATMFLAPAETPGLNVGRHIPTIDLSMVGGHCEVSFEDVFVPDADVLGEPHEGFRYAQVRLGPARMTHVMRWLGAARRAHETAVRYAAEREMFGSKLSSLGMAQQAIADNEIDLAASRALLSRACNEIDSGGRASEETSIAKVFASEAIFRVVDRSVQLCGGMGVSEDLPLARIMAEVRPFRIYDGPSEVHRWSIAKRATRRIAASDT